MYQSSFLAAHSLKIALIHAGSEAVVMSRRRGRASSPDAAGLLVECRDYCTLLVEVSLPCPTLCMRLSSKGCSSAPD